LPKPDFTNLNEYFDIGLELAAAGKAPAAREALCDVYRNKLEELAASVRVHSDGRLWKEPAGG
jgi:hypothetical protein